MIRRNGRQPGNEEFMYQFFVEDEQIANDLVIIEGSDVNIIRNVLRMKMRGKSAHQQHIRQEFLRND